MVENAVHCRYFTAVSHKANPLLNTPFNPGILFVVYNKIHRKTQALQIHLFIFLYKYKYMCINPKKLNAIVRNHMPFTISCNRENKKKPCYIRLC